MSYAQHIHHSQGYAPSGPDGGFPSAVPPPPGFFRDGPGPPPPPPPFTSGYQGYFDDGYPPPPPRPEHIGHYNQPWGWGYRDDTSCSSFITTCLAALCCCGLLNRCCY